ncbi:MAG: methyltransferase domain-containing protein [Parachlamydiaceae bacterium]|nr:methyltransferase domain-containing protein [Parachlamydiaceae bacterium]
MPENLWDAKQYDHFVTERSQPFHDLMTLIQPFENMNVVDLGCGTGALTRQLHDKLKPISTLGIDSSVEMLQESKKFETENLKFLKIKVEDFHPKEKFNLILSNAALQWIPNHQKLFSNLYQWLENNGQLAVQVPSNFEYPSHTIANKIASEAPFAVILKGGYKSPVLTIEEYSSLLYSLGFKEQIVRQQVYAHLMDSTDSLIDWVKGSLLTYYKSPLPNGLYTEFLKVYRRRLLDEIGWSSPFLFPMKRTLIWAKK